MGADWIERRRATCSARSSWPERGRSRYRWPSPNRRCPPSVPEKAANIRLAAQRLNGVVVPPGGMFSFNDEVGPTTLESGFQWGFGLVTGAQGGAHTVPSVAGGICQVATTLFQSVFWGGYQLEERFWHLYWIPAYTSRDVVGIDATVDS